MKLYLIALLLFFSAGTLSFGQSAGIVQGKVRDSITHAAIEGADVFLLSQAEHKPLFHTHTGTKGFVFREVPDGSYHMVIAAAGYSNDTTVLVMKDGTAAAVNVVLQQAANELEGITLKSTPRPVTVRGDTVAFHPDAFAVRPNAQLEDLLRKLPGVEVDKDGNITMQGQKVDKITVNGKDLFLGNMKQANSVPVEMIASIEAFGTQSDRAKFSGVKESGTTKTLNLKTKAGMDNAWFGNAYAGKGEAGSYAAGGMFTQFGGERLLMGTLKLNNINNRFLGVESKNLGPQSGLQSTAGLDLVYREKWGSKLTAALSFNGNNQKTDVLRTTSRRTFFSDSSLQENRLGQSINKTENYPAHFNFTYDADSMNQLQLSSSISIQRSNNNSQDTAATQTLLNSGVNYLGSRTETNNSVRQTGFNLNNQLEWRHRFTKPRRTLQLSLSQTAHKENSPGGISSVLNTFDHTGSPLQNIVTNQQFSQGTNGQGYGTTLLYTEPIAQYQTLAFTYSFNTQLEKSDKKSSDYDSATGQFDKENPLTTNRFNNHNTSHRIEGAYNMNSKTVNYQLGVGWQYSTTDNLNFSPASHIKQHFTNLFPRAMLSFNLAQGKNLSFNYSGSSSAPSIDQLQPLPDLSNPLLVKTGNPDLKQQFSHAVGANYNVYNTKTFTGIMLSMQADMTQNQIVSSSTLLAGGVQQLQYLNINGAYHVGTMATYSFGLGSKKAMQSNGSVGTNLRYGHDIGMVNGAQNISNSITWGQQLKLNYSAGTRFIGEFTGGIDYTGYQYSIRPEQNTRSWSQNATVNINYELPLGINIQSSYMFTHMGTSGLLPSQSTGVLNAAIYKRLFAKQQWQLRVSGFDLLNTNRNYTQTAAANYIYSQQTNLLQRMLLVSLVYDIKFFPNLKKGGRMPFSVGQGAI
jgi:hypothetical protein